MEEALKALAELTKQLDEFKAKQEKNIGSKADKTEIETISKMITDLTGKVDLMEAAKVSEALAAIKKQMEEIASDVQLAKENKGGKGLNKSFGQVVIEKLKELGVTSKSMSKSTRHNFEVNKEVGEMTTANVIPVGTDSIPFSLSQAEAGLTRIVKRRPWLMEIANVSPTNKMYVQWAEQTGQEGAAGETAEGSAKEQIDFDWTEKSAKVEKITAYVKVSKEMLDDLDGIRSEIDTELVEEILLKADEDILSGDGTTPTLNGILNQDTAYNAGAFAGTIVDANKYDVLRTAIAQVVAANFIPNYILMHPSDVAALDLSKASDGHYVMPPFKSADGLVISGVRVLENTGQTVDKFTVGDFTKLNIKLREGVNIDVGYDGNDFTENLVTILGEIRLACYIKANHVGAFVSGDFSDAIASLDTGS